MTLGSKVEETGRKVLKYESIQHEQTLANDSRHERISSPRLARILALHDLWQIVFGFLTDVHCSTLPNFVSGAELPRPMVTKLARDESCRH